jgi:hypothetical protein
MEQVPDVSWEVETEILDESDRTLYPKKGISIVPTAE